MLAYRHADLITKSGNSLWLGDCCAAEDLEWLHDNGIRTVITAAASCDLHYQVGIRHIVYSLNDTKHENALKYFDQVTNQIKECLRTGAVLVHCGAGVSRSATLVIAYLIKCHSMNFQTALRLCKQKRPQVCPNLGFELQLKAYQDMLRPKKYKNSNFPTLMRETKLGTSLKRSFFTPADFRGSQNRSLHQTSREEQDVNCLRRIAQFRFGQTNFQKWHIVKGQ